MRLTYCFCVQCLIFLFIAFLFNNLTAQRLTYYSPINDVDNYIDHFSYVNPDAPKGGVVVYGKEGVFSNFNPLIPKGNVGCASLWTFDRLMFRSFEELIGYYPLVAESFEINNNKVTFFLNPDAKWSNGEKIIANDVLSSFNALKNKALEYIKFDYRDVEGVNIINDETIEFVLNKNHENDVMLKLMNIPLIVPEAFENSLYVGKVSGAYYVFDFIKDEFINYKRNTQYWANDLLVNRGRFNFDNVICKYYNSYQMVIQALKAGEIDIHNEKKIKNWQLNYENIDNKTEIRLKKFILKSRGSNSNKVRTLSFNNTKYPFNKLKVRKALSLLLNFEEINKNNFLNGYQRANGLILGTELVNNNKNFTIEELNLLRKFNINEDFLVNNYDIDNKKCINNRKECIDYAISLLKEEGFNIVNGKMLDQRGQQLNVEIKLSNEYFSGLINNFIDTLNSLGIKAEIIVLDNIAYSKILREKNFSIINYDYYFGRIPSAELYSYFHSSMINKQYMNILNINNPDLDILIENINMNDDDLEKLKLYLDAVNRIFVENYYSIFLWHNPYYRLVMWDKFSMSDNFIHSNTYYDEKNLFGLDSWWKK